MLTKSKGEFFYFSIFALKLKISAKVILLDFDEKLHVMLKKISFFLR